MQRADHPAHARTSAARLGKCAAFCRLGSQRPAPLPRGARQTVAGATVCHRQKRGGAVWKARKGENTFAAAPSAHYRIWSMRSLRRLTIALIFGLATLALPSKTADMTLGHAPSPPLARAAGTHAIQTTMLRPRETLEMALE